MHIPCEFNYVPSDGNAENAGLENAVQNCNVKMSSVIIMLPLQKLSNGFKMSNDLCTETFKNLEKSPIVFS